jgi:hypothetical protein
MHPIALWWFAVFLFVIVAGVIAVGLEWKSRRTSGKSAACSRGPRTGT